METQRNDPAFPARQSWTVSALVERLKQIVEREFFDVWIEGEISNFKASAARHLYFTLKDNQAQLKAAMFAGQARFLRFQPRDGLQVLARARISIYEARGELQCYVEHLEPRGQGSMQLAFEQLKARLEAEGLFRAERKRQLPLLPARIGLVTSGRGAAVADMIRILQRRFPGVQVLLFPVAVQGEAAPEEIRRALEQFAEWWLAGDPELAVEVIIAGRGGGSIEDLWAFNTETVARALAASPVPVISAVGHETDFTIADFVADLRAPTPSAAAEMVLRPRADWLAEIGSRQRQLAQALHWRLSRQRQRLHELIQRRGFQRLRQGLLERAQRLDEAEFRLRRAAERRIQSGERRLELVRARLSQGDPRLWLRHRGRDVGDLSARLLRAQRERIALGRQRLAAGTALLHERNPLELLQRGYALVYRASGPLVTQAADLRPGDRLRTRFADGWAESEVLGAEPPRRP